MWRSVSSLLNESGRRVTTCTPGQRDGDERMTHGAIITEGPQHFFLGGGVIKNIWKNVKCGGNRGKSSKDTDESQTAVHEQTCQVVGVFPTLNLSSCGHRAQEFSCRR